MRKEFNGDDRFFPITYKETWKVVREIAEGSGTPYNKAAYEAEAKREAEALAKKQQAAAGAEAVTRDGMRGAMDASDTVQATGSATVDRSLVIRNLRKEYRAGPAGAEGRLAHGRRGAA